MLVVVQYRGRIEDNIVEIHEHELPLDAREWDIRRSLVDSGCVLQAERHAGKVEQSFVRYEGVPLVVLGRAWYFPIAAVTI